jgi:excinuclease ABC subunit C
LNSDLQTYIQTLPSDPGIYKYFDKNQKIIYIGKAKNLKKRVSSYFNKKKFENSKTKILVSKIHRIEFTVVDSEMEALLLENSLVKEHQPRYNIILKDDKSYPLIRISNERFPRVFPIRNPKYDGSQFFGPYTSVRVMNIVVELIKSIYPLRNCNYNLSETNIQSGKFKTCLEYQIGNCHAPCVGLQSESDYMNSIKRIKEILRGDLREVKQELQHSMTMASENLRFEEAEKFRIKLEALDRFRSKSTVVSHTIKNVDVFAIIKDERQAFLNYLKVDNGMVTRTMSVEYKILLDESKADVLSHGVLAMRERYQSNANEIILPFPMSFEMEGVKTTVPKAGDKKKLLDLAIKNTLFYKKQKLDHYEKLNPGTRANRLMAKMKIDLNLQDEPRHIECFDNSNIQGSQPVAACVVFKDGKPSKKDYRHFNIKTVVGPDDFASMAEVVSRRYSRMLKEQNTLPHLIVIDGGKGQLSSVVGALKELGIYGKLAVIGIAKRLEEIYYPEDPLPLYIDKASETLKVIQHLRDEAHRFGITHHRNRRSKATIRTALTDIEGIGTKSAELLLKKFKSVKSVKQQNADTLTPVVGMDKAKKLIKYFKNES